MSNHGNTFFASRKTSVYLLSYLLYFKAVTSLYIRFISLGGIPKINLIGEIMSRITYKTTIRDSYTPEELKNTFKFDWKSWRENPEILGPCWTLNNFKPVMMFCNPLDATFRKLYHDNLIFITQEDAEAAGELFKAYASIVMQQVHGTDVQLDLFPGTKVTRIPGRAKIYQFYAQSKKVY